MLLRLLVFIPVLLTFAAGAFAAELKEFSPPMVADRPVQFASGLWGFYTNSQTANNFCVLKGLGPAESYEPVVYRRGRAYTGEVAILELGNGEVTSSVEEFLKTDIFARITCRKVELK